MNGAAADPCRLARQVNEIFAAAAKEPDSHAARAGRRLRRGVVVGFLRLVHLRPGALDRPARRMTNAAQAKSNAVTAATIARQA